MSIINSIEEEKMKENSAATKIQAGFRGYRVRKQLKIPKLLNNNNNIIMDNNKSLIKYQDTRKKLEEKSATKIQAGIRGFLVRKRNQIAQDAAVTIQAGFRGFKTRKQLKKITHWHKDYNYNYNNTVIHSINNNFNDNNLSLHRRYGGCHVRVLGISVILKKSALPIIVGTSPRTRRRRQLSSHSPARPWPGEGVVALALKYT